MIQQATTICLSLVMCALILKANAQEPLRTAWLTNPNPHAQTAHIRPEVHSITTQAQTVEVRSAGISLYYFGPLQTPADHVERIRQWQFTLPRFPTPQTGAHLSVRPDIVGVFVNGVPMYNQLTTSSYQGQNLWHFDSVAGSDDGTFVATGRPRDEQHPITWGLLEKLMRDGSAHSPLIGFAFDGYPIYGPWGMVEGKLRQMRSSYRLRQIKRRTHVPDGTPLTPGQYGPEISAEFPLGGFVEDYEFSLGAGDLDKFNGRFAITPEYPNGTYAYFLSTDGAGRLAFPYLLAGQYFGKLSTEQLTQAVRDVASNDAPILNENKELIRLGASSQFELRVKGETLAAGQPIRLSFQARDADNQPIRHLEYVHERPLHLLIVSDDLAEFEHIHPELVAGDRYDVTHTFKHGGRYRLYADFTPPGSAQRLETFELSLTGKLRAAIPLQADECWTKERDGLQLTLTTKQPFRAGEDVEFGFAIRDKATGKPPENLTPFLGAWAHFVLIDETKRSFIHAHPIEESTAKNVKVHAHLHNAQSLGDPPSEIRVLTNFSKPGLYKLWAQFQRGNEVITQPFTIRVAEVATPSKATISIASDALKLQVGANGFAPASLSIPAGKPVRLAITRDVESNCASRIVFPSLGIARDLPLGTTTIIELPAQPAGELRFTCGMGMYKGALVIH
ncbi:MAG: YHYH protein [Blastocatellia bacterium]|nr:YHYH protein [Blastocatellia bacterium]